MFVDILINDCCNLINILYTFIDCPLIFVLSIANSDISANPLNWSCPELQSLMQGSTRLETKAILLDFQKLLNNDQNRSNVGPIV